MKIDLLPRQDRPREKLLRLGVGMLTDSELLALILGTGTRGASAIELAQKMLHSLGGVTGLRSVDVASLCALKGVGTGKAATVAALSELCRRIENPERANLDETVDYLARNLPVVEEAYVLAIDARKKVLSTRLVGKGASDALTLSSAEALRCALSIGAARFVFLHTHPSGIPLPSKGDIEFTMELHSAATKVGVELCDHLILVPEGRFSFRENGLLPRPRPKR